VNALPSITRTDRHHPSVVIPALSLDPFFWSASNGTMGPGSVAGVTV